MCIEVENTSVQKFLNTQNHRQIYTYSRKSCSLGCHLILSEDVVFIWWKRKTPKLQRRSDLLKIEFLIPIPAVEPVQDRAACCCFQKGFCHSSPLRKWPRSWCSGTLPVDGSECWHSILGSWESQHQAHPGLGGCKDAPHLPTSVCSPPHFLF